MTDPASEIKKMWRLFALGPNSVFELRPLWPKGVPDPKPARPRHFRAKAFNEVDECRAAVEETALDLNRQGYNVYTVMNPISPDFSGPGAAKDPDIWYRDQLLIDIDRIGDTSVPASQAELGAAEELARRIRAEMTRRGWDDPVVVMSGNGYHLYYALDDVENTPEAAALISNTLKGLAAAFNNSIVGIDTSVHNASRITKVPGTIMRKGIATEDRPYRMAVVCDGW